MLKRRKVVSAEHVRKHFKMKLECGHEVTKRDSGHKNPPKVTRCDPCEIVMDRARAVGGWFQARTIGASHAALKLLEAEGLVESSKEVMSAAVNWRVRG
jgi:hypothetical protein